MRDFLKDYIPIALLIAAGFVLAYRFIDPAPPNHLRIAAGALGGGYDQYAENLKAALARDIRRPEARELALKALDRLQADTGRLQIPNAFVEDLYHLREHIDFVKRMV